MTEIVQGTSRRTFRRTAIAVVLSPIAIAVGLITDFILASMLVRPFLEGFNSRGEIIPEGAAFVLLLLACVGGALAGLWLLVWRLVR